MIFSQSSAWHEFRQWGYFLRIISPWFQWYINSDSHPRNVHSHPLEITPRFAVECQLRARFQLTFRHVLYLFTNRNGLRIPRLRTWLNKSKGRRRGINVRGTMEFSLSLFVPTTQSRLLANSGTWLVELDNWEVDTGVYWFIIPNSGFYWDIPLASSILIYKSNSDRQDRDTEFAKEKTSHPEIRVQFATTCPVEAGRMSKSLLRFIIPTRSRRQEGQVRVWDPEQNQHWKSDLPSRYRRDVFRNMTRHTVERFIDEITFKLWPIMTMTKAGWCPFLCDVSLIKP